MTRAFPEKDDCVVPSTPAIDPLDYVFDSCGVPSPPTSAFSNSATPSVIPQPTPVGSGGCLVGYLVAGEITDVQAASDVGNPGAFHRYKAEDCHGCLSLDDWTVAINDVNLSGEDELGSSMPPAAIGDKCLLGYWCATKVIVIWPATLSVEWGVLRSAPNSTPTASVTLVPCDKDGAVITDADDVEVLIRNDRSEVVLSGRGWVVPDEILKIVGTIFSFIRLREAVTIDGSSVEGVLVGEGQDPRVAVSSADTVPGFLRYTAGDVQDHHKIVGDAEADADAATTGEWIECEIINAAGEEQLKIKHVGPGASCCCCAACLLTGIDIDAKGHVRQFRYDNGAGPYWTGII